MKPSTISQSIDLACKAIAELVDDYKDHPLGGTSENIAKAIARDAMNRLIVKQMEEGILSGKCPTVTMDC